MPNFLYERTKNKESIIQYLAVFTVYKIMLEIVYIVAVSYWYSYLGFVYKPVVWKCVLSYVLFEILVCKLERSVSVNGILVNTFFSICITPMLSFYWLADKNTLFLIYEVLFFIILNTVTKGNKKTLVFTWHNDNFKYDTIINVIFIGYVLIAIFLGIKRGGIDARSFSFKSIYDLRSETSNISGIESYLVEWCAKSFFPIFVVYFTYVKKYVKAIICLGTQIFLYLCFGFKAYLLSAIMVMAVYFITKNSEKKNHRSNIRIMIIFFVGLIPSFFSTLKGVFGTVCFSINGVFAMRMLFEPARIQNGYFEFFSQNSKLFFSEGLIGKLLGLNYTYDTAIGFVVTRYLNGADAVSNSNTGIIADSYSQLGLLGIIVIALLMGIIIVLIKRICVYTPSYCIASMFFYPVIMWNDNPLLTNLLTNGLALNIILLILVEGALRLRNRKINKQLIEKV